LSVGLYVLWSWKEFLQNVGNELLIDVENLQMLVAQNIALVITVTIGIVPIFILLVQIIYGRHRKTKTYYDFGWKASSGLMPIDIMAFRAYQKYGFYDYYYPRKEDEIIRTKIHNGQNILVIGSPLAGKSRAIYQALKTLNKKFDVILPKPIDIDPTKFVIPFCWHRSRKKILLLDDLNKFAERENFVHLLDEFLRRNATIVASCCFGPEYDKVRKKLDAKLSIFGDPIKISGISKKEAEQIAKKTRRTLPEGFDGNIGSIFLPLDAMKERFKNCSKEEKGILRSIKRLYIALLWEERGIYSLDKMKRVCSKEEEMEFKQYEWTHLLDELQNKGFLEKINERKIWVEEVYLDSIVEDSFNLMDNIKDMEKTFPDEFQWIFTIHDKGLSMEVKRKKSKLKRPK